MVGRFIGSGVMRFVSPGQLLAFLAIGAMLLIIISANTTGALSGYSLLTIGLTNSIMFPTIFALACEKLGPRVADGSGIINVAIFGGAVLPLLTGILADLSGGSPNQAGRVLNLDREARERLSRVCVGMLVSLCR